MEYRRTYPVTKRPSFVSHLHPPSIPAREARFWYTFGLGGISVLMCLVLLVTGALELFYYVPTSTGANVSLQTITILVPYGRLVRSLHFWSAQILVVTSLLHMLRVVLSGAYKRPRSFNWLLGLSLLVLVLLCPALGYRHRLGVIGGNQFIEKHTLAGYRSLCPGCRWGCHQ